jgi:hypothetical protein
MQQPKKYPVIATTKTTPSTSPALPSPQPKSNEIRSFEPGKENPVDWMHKLFSSDTLKFIDDGSPKTEEQKNSEERLHQLQRKLGAAVRSILS